MNKPQMEIVRLSEMKPGNEADIFVLLSKKDSLLTKEGKPYYMVAFRDSILEIKVPIWADAPFFNECKETWEPGKFYKIRGIVRMSRAFGRQLDIRKIREVGEADRLDGFDENDCRPSSRYSPESMYDEILDLARKHISDKKLLQLITRLFKDHREALLEAAAAKIHHHTFFGGLLEHTLSVTQIAVYLADHFSRLYPELKGTFSKSLIVSGAILHDIGKIREQRNEIATSEYTFEGQMIGHIVLGRDFVREYGKIVGLDPVTQTHLEHIVLSHQRLPEWGSPKPPMSLEAMLVHHADSSDALFACYLRVMELDDTEGMFTAKRNMMNYPIYRGTEAKNME